MSLVREFFETERLPRAGDYSNSPDIFRFSRTLPRAVQLAPGVNLIPAVSALDLEARDDFRPDDQPGSDADAWFSALDDRTIEVGQVSCVARVLGIHASADGLWIQLSCVGPQEISVVVHVTPATRVEDVLLRLRTDPPMGRPLEVIDMDGPHSTPVAVRMGRTNAAGALPTPRNAH